MAPILKDTCLCAIVRNELTNPAGGILDYVESVVPHVESAVIVDTGSTDGTREVLEGAQGKYPHLKIFDKKFDGFANSRNFSVKKGRQEGAEYCLFLDADERLSRRDILDLELLRKKYFADSYHFDFYHVSFEDGSSLYHPSWYARHIKFSTNPLFDQPVWERLVFNSVNGKNTGIKIKHFLPSPGSHLLKEHNYISYKHSPHFFGRRRFLKSYSPSWKIISPYRSSFNFDSLTE